MKLQIHPLIGTLLIAGILILVFLLIRGCNQSKLQVSKAAKLDSLNNILLHVVSNDKLVTDSTKNAFHDSLEFVNGQLALANEQKLRTEAELQDVIKSNKVLIEKHRLAQYADTTAVTVPSEYITDCEGCFTNLEKTTTLVNRYKTDINTMEAKQREQNKIYQKRFKELDAEKLGFYNKINTLAKASQDAIDQLKPHGRLYLTWGVLWRPWPVAAGGGLMYQNKRNLIWGINCYYGQNGTTVETNIHFPLSLKFR
jgi:hypothetical protein